MNKRNTAKEKKKKHIFLKCILLILLILIIEISVVMIFVREKVGQEMEEFCIKKGGQISPIYSNKCYINNSVYEIVKEENGGYSLYEN